MVAYRIGLYTPWSTDDPAAWSGMIRPMVEALRQIMDVEMLPAVQEVDAVQERLRARLRGLRGRPSMPTHTMATARRRSAALGAALRDRSGPDLDAVVAIAGSTDILALPSGLPLVQVTDATFPAITGFYPLATGLGRRNEQQGDRVEHAGATVTSHYAVATEWAARSLVEDVGVPCDRVSVVPFGPGTAVSGTPGVRRPGRTLRVLAVIADWERKRGDDVLEAVRRARASAAVELTVVGRSPDELPAWVRAEGFVSRERLAGLYADHDVLVDLALANAAGVVITDALTSGLPVVATRVGGVETIVKDGITGWLVVPDAAVEEAAAILRGLTPAAVSRASAAAGHDAQERLNWKAWARGVEEAVTSALASSAAVLGDMRTQRSVVMISPMLPSAADHESAGERLVRDVVHVVEEHASLTMLTRDGPANRRAISRGGVPRHVLVPHATGRRESAARSVGLIPVLWPHELAAASHVLASAEIIDVQWEENGLLLGALRRINPHARLVVTLHDVLSQRFARQRDLQGSRWRRAVWHARHIVARALERAIVAQADDVVVLSQKDADLLPRGRAQARVHVVPPAITGALRPARPSGRAHHSPRLLFVGFMARWENEDAMHWFVTEILPAVRATHPTVRMAVAGGGLREHVKAELVCAGVDVLDFVADLEPLYAEADAVVVPLRYGAGVKFKVVDALVRGVPVVTTTVGNEGITPSSAAHVADDAASFAQAVLNVLADPSAAESHARSSAVAVAQEFGLDGFHARMRAIYA